MGFLLVIIQNKEAPHTHGNLTQKRWWRWWRGGGGSCGCRSTNVLVIWFLIRHFDTAIFVCFLCSTFVICTSTSDASTSFCIVIFCSSRVHINSIIFVIIRSSRIIIKRFFFWTIFFFRPFIFREKLVVVVWSTFAVLFIIRIHGIFSNKIFFIIIVDTLLLAGRFISSSSPPYVFFCRIRLCLLVVVVAVLCCSYCLINRCPGVSDDASMVAEVAILSE
mmetsp:Transcript_33834/g.50168  ORF Transcript_33834/g.50168 Transcript_33834/m.50168 type:complete len:220 (+) Transcript_33834:2954-3613(+)